MLPSTAIRTLGELFFSSVFMFQADFSCRERVAILEKEGKCSENIKISSDEIRADGRGLKIAAVMISIPHAQNSDIDNCLDVHV